MSLGANVTCDYAEHPCPDSARRVHARRRAPPRGLRQTARDMVWPAATLVSAGLHYSGLLRLYQAVRRPRGGPRVVVLMYHRVCDEVPNHRHQCVSSRNFTRQMRWLAGSRLKLVSLDEVADYLAGRGELPDESIAVTFDDGYRDFYTHAFPVLEECRIPATVFVTTGAVDGHAPLWSDRLAVTLCGPCGKGMAFRRGLRPSRRRFGDVSKRPSPGSGRRLVTKIDAVLEYMKELDQEERLAAVAALEELTPSRAEGDLMLTWEMLRAMRGGRVSFGGHTVTHPVLSQLDPTRTAWELRECKSRLETVLQQDITLFAYPNGTAADFNRQTLDLLRETGYRLAVTTEKGVVSRESHPFMLCRCGIPDVPPFALAARLFSLLDLHA